MPAFKAFKPRSERPGLTPLQMAAAWSKDSVPGESGESEESEDMFRMQINIFSWAKQARQRVGSNVVNRHIYMLGFYPLLWLPRELLLLRFAASQSTSSHFRSFRGEDRENHRMELIRPWSIEVFRFWQRDLVGWCCTSFIAIRQSGSNPGALDKTLFFLSKMPCEDHLVKQAIAHCLARRCRLSLLGKQRASTLTGESAHSRLV